MVEIVLLILLSLIAAGLGKKIYRIFKMNFSKILEEFVFSTALGWAVLSYLALLLNLLDLLSRIHFYSLVFLSIIFVFPELKSLAGYLRHLRQGIKSLPGLKQNFFIYLLLAFLSVHLIFALFGALAPPIEWDELVYHLPLPKSFLQHLEFGNYHLPSVISFPQNAQMLYLLAMGLKSDILAKLIHFSLGIMLALAIFSFSKKYFSLRTSVLATTIFYTMPLIGSALSPTASADFFLYLFEFLAIYAFFNWWEDSKNRVWLAVSGLLLGFAMGVKHLSLVPFVLLVLGIMIKVLSIEKKSFAFLLKSLVTFICLAFVFSGYWYIKSIILLGNPLWPLCYRIFGGLKIPEVTLEHMNYHILRFGPGRSLLDFLSLPWNLTYYPERFDGSYLSPLFLVFLPVLGFFKKKRVIIYILIFSGLYLIIWFLLLSQQQRYLSSIIPLLSICTAFAIEKVIAFDNKFSKVVYLIIFSWLFISTFNIIQDHKDKISPALGLESPRDYLSKKLWFYRDIDYINRNLPEDAHILLISFDRNYYLERKFTFGELTQQLHLLYKSYDLEGLLLHLRQLGITHLLIPKRHFNRQRAIEEKEDLKLFDLRVKDFGPLVELFNDRELRDKYLQLIHVGGLNLYKIKGR